MHVILLLLLLLFLEADAIRYSDRTVISFWGQIAVVVTQLLNGPSSGGRGSSKQPNWAHTGALKFII
jgi:hypothetical protein